MHKKLIYLVCFVLVMSLVSSASAELNIWSNVGGDRLWENPDNWSLGRVPSTTEPNTTNTKINGLDDPYAGGGGPIINSGVNASTGLWDTWGPEWNIGMDIRGGSYSGPAFFAPNVEGDTTNPAYINLGEGLTGGTINVVNFLMGDSPWFHGGGSGATYNQWSGTCIANDYIWLGGKMNLYGGYTKATNGFAMASAGQPNTMTTLTIYGGSGGKMSLPEAWGDPLVPAVEIVNGWITDGYLVAAGPGPGPWHINIDTLEEPGRVVLTSVPEPSTMALLCLGGLALIRRKRS